MRPARAWLGGALAIMVGGLAAAAGAQEPEASEEPALPPVTLSEEESQPAPIPPVTLSEDAPEAEPAPAEPEREAVPILEPVGWSYRDQGEQSEDAEPLQDDIAFVVPGDLRTRSGEQGRLAMPGVEDPLPPPPFGVSLGAGFTRQIVNDGVNYLRLEQRFEARIPDLSMLRVGLGVAEMIGDRFVFEVGPRIGLGAAFCSEPELHCEGVVAVQPGLAAGYFGAAFDLAATLDAKVLFARIFELSLTGTLSFIDTVVFVSAALNAGLAF